MYMLVDEFNEEFEPQGMRIVMIHNVVNTDDMDGQRLAYFLLWKDSQIIGRAMATVADLPYLSEVPSGLLDLMEVNNDQNILLAQEQVGGS